MASTSISMLAKTSNSAKADECYTPPEAVVPLLQYLDPNLMWYEATSGISKSIVECMRGNGFDCMASEGDFFGDLPDFDGIVTNPPYSKKDRFIERCYEIGKPFALLLPVTTLQGGWRGGAFDEHGIDILTLNQRVDFTGKGSPHFGVAWFTRGILPDRLIFRDLPKL